MPPEPLPTHVIHQILYHLLPPTAPLPDHLLSRDLLQRHHFLDINPDNLEEYLCWPSSNPSEIIRELGFLGGNPDILERASHEIVYDEDPEGDSSESDHEALGRFRARVRIVEGQDLWILFIWQGANEPGSRGEAGWRYFDTKRVLPSELRPRATSSALESSPGLDASNSLSPAEVSRPASPSSDAYWENYGAGSSSYQNSPYHMAKPLASGSKEEDEEAAYWATYAAVQGSADSTIPSPPTRKTPLLPDSYRGAGPDDEMERATSTGYYLSEGNLGPSEYLYRGEADYGGSLDQSTPYGLGFETGGFSQHESVARVLKAFVPEKPSPSGDSQSDDSVTHARKLAAALFPVLSLQEYQEQHDKSGDVEAHEKSHQDEVPHEASVVAPKTLLINEPQPSLISPTLPSAVVIHDQGKISNDDLGVSMAIQGIYKMWLSQQPLDASSSSSAEARAQFLDIVSRSIAST